MASIIIEIQSDVIAPSISTVTILHKARIAAFKLKQETFLQWIDQELNGYGACALDDLPRYRVLIGNLVAKNPYHGWIPAIIRNADLAETVSRFGCWESISEIERQTKSIGKNASLLHIFAHAKQEALMKIFNEDMQFAVQFSSARYAAIIDKVRNSVLNWSLELEAIGIIGDGMQFTNENRKGASIVTQNIFATNIGILGASGDQTAQGLIQQDSVRQPEDLTSLIASLSILIESLPSEKKKAAEVAVKELEQNSSEPGKKKEAVSTLRRIAEGAGAGVVGRGLGQILEKISEFLN